MYGVYFLAYACMIREWHDLRDLPSPSIVYRLPAMTAGFWEKVAEQLATGHTSSECSSRYAVLREAPRKKPAAKEGVALTGVVLIDERGGC